MQSSSFLLLRLESLEIIETTAAGNLTLELFELIEAHARGICSKVQKRKRKSES